MYSIAAVPVLNPVNMCDAKHTPRAQDPGYDTGVMFILCSSHVNLTLFWGLCFIDMESLARVTPFSCAI